MSLVKEDDVFSHNSGDENGRALLYKPPLQTWRKTRFYAQFFISLIVLVFSMVMTAMQEQGCERTVFISLISGIVAYWLPAPSAH